MFPGVIKSFLYENNEKHGCYCLAINNDNKIVQSFGDANLLNIRPPAFNTPVTDFLPGILTETFAEYFEIPFYNINNDTVCNLYFLKYPKISYLLLVDKSEIFTVTQKYQQFAHDDNISKNRYKRLSNKLAKAKKKLKQANREKATLIAMLSHELGTPLTSILGYSELLLKNKINCQKSIGIINRNAHYLKHMIENTLMFGSSEAQGLHTNIENILVDELFTSLQNTILPAAIHKNLLLTIKDTGNETINIDVTRTKQILLNLLNNAVKYTDTGSIELSFFSTNEKYMFSVKDTGLGVPENMQKNIFNPWQRIKANTEQGSGIGLFISQKLAEAIGGNLQLKSSSVESGSIFQLIIPSAQKVQSNNTKKIDTQICKGKSILVIDDDEDIINLIEALLASSNLTIFTARNLPLALTILKNATIDTILIDLNLGTIKAVSCVEPINAINPNIPILLMSAMLANKNKAMYQSKGFVDIISKPLTSASLLEAITQTLRVPL
ncbi:MAG: hybrid sensor histidine kinase/response regulator [Proteobacteria bacterium]|nr:hybrid sensor histidine kinase/response regulator [Pseudomonadota bacterium]